MIILDQLVPENYLVRNVKVAIDFSFIYSLVEDAYSTEWGRPSINPVVEKDRICLWWTLRLLSLSRRTRTILSYNHERRLSSVCVQSLHCKECPLLTVWTQSKKHQKLIQRHVWEENVEEADHLRHTDENKAIYARRKETIERVFADAKEKHGMRWTTLRGLEKLSMQAMLTFTAMNLKKMANWLWKTPKIA